MEKTRFAIISDLFKLSKIIGRSLKLAESLANGKVEDEAGHKDISKNIRREMKPVPLLLSGVREYIAEHDDKELAHQFVRLHKDAKRLHDLCSAHQPELSKEAFYAGIVYTSIEVIGQYFFPDGSRQGKARPMTRIEATDCIDTIRTVIRKCTAETGENKGKDDIGEEAYALLADMDKEKSRPSRNTSQTPTTRIWHGCSQRISQKPSTFLWCSMTAIQRHSWPGLRCSISF